MSPKEKAVAAREKAARKASKKRAARR